MSSILTFSNRSVKLFTLKNRFLITAKVLHSIRMCLTVQVVWQVKPCGCGSCFSMKEWVSLVWPIRNRDITNCSLLDFLDTGLHSPKVGLNLKEFIVDVIATLLLATVVEGYSKAPFSVATTPRCSGRRYYFPWISPLYPRYAPYISECWASRYQVPFLKSLVWLDLGLNPETTLL